VVFTKAQHNSTLLLIQLVETHQAPDQKDAAEDNAQKRTGEATLRRAAATATAAKHAGNALLKLFKSFVEIRRALVASAPRIARAFITAPGLIP
jgi:hypothetical protein